MIQNLFLVLLLTRTDIKLHFFYYAGICRKTIQIEKLDHKIRLTKISVNACDLKLNVFNRISQHYAEFLSIAFILYIKLNNIEKCLIHSRTLIES